jgi:hypothetical protein
LQGPAAKLALFLLRVESTCENAWMRLQVECYSGRKADERPVRFRLDEREYTIEEIVAQWYGPDHAFFKIRASDGNRYVIRHETAWTGGGWELVS